VVVDGHMHIVPAHAASAPAEVAMSARPGAVKRPSFLISGWSRSPGALCLE
jgi:hypothetical protein